MKFLFEFRIFNYQVVPIKQIHFSELGLVRQFFWVWTGSKGLFGLVA